MRHIAVEKGRLGTEKKEKKDLVEYNNESNWLKKFLFHFRNLNSCFVSL